MTNEEKLKLAFVEKKSGNFDNAKGILKDVLSDTTEGNAHHTEAMRIMGVIAWENGSYETAFEYLNAALAMYEDVKDKRGIAHTTSTIANVYRNLGNFLQSMTYDQKALEIYKEIGDQANTAGMISNIGITYDFLGDYPRSLEYYLKALSLLELMGNNSRTAGIICNIGVIYNKLGDIAHALEYYQKALLLAEKTADKLYTANILSNLGNSYADISDYPRSLECYHRSFALHEELGNRIGIANNISNIGNVYHVLGDYQQALEYLLNAFALYEELGCKPEIATNTGNIGILYANENYAGNDFAKAEEYLLEAVAMNEEIGAKQNLCENIDGLAKLYKKQKRWEEYALQLEKYHKTKDELRSEEAIEQAQLMEHRRKIEESERDRQVKLARFQEQEKILHNILPSQIAERIVSGEKTIADTHENVSVLFSDIVGFTKLSQQESAVELVGMLNGIFTQFDQLARKHGLEKIKTIGDAYMAVCGAPIPVENHAERTAQFALDVAELMNNYQTTTGDKVMIRIGLHTGSVVAGIIGENKFAYDMWGDAVNTASRMESHGEAGKIHVSEEFMHALSLSSPTSPMSLHFQERGEMEIKGKGKMKTYFLEK